MNIEEATKYLGVQQCDFSGECDYCTTPAGPSYAAIFHADGVLETDYYICGACAIKHAEESQAENSKVAELEAQGHTYHCSARQVWGDGECECKLQGIIPGSISRMILNA